LQCKACALQNDEYNKQVQHATNDDAVMFDAAWAHGLEKVSVLLRQGGQAAGLRVAAAAAAAAFHDFHHQFAVFTLEFAVNLRWSLQ
jgi:hypothetical protein